MPLDWIYIKTDKNGTKYYEDWNCQRCGGFGALEQWYNTGKTCYGCGGTGRRANLRIVKQYTPEYSAKLQAKREAKLEKQMALRKKEGYEAIMQKDGYNENGIKYIYCGKTYDIKDDLKAHNARWDWGMSRWTSKNPISNYRCIEMNAKDTYEWDDIGGWFEQFEKVQNWCIEHRAELEESK